MRINFPTDLQPGSNAWLKPIKLPETHNPYIFPSSLKMIRENTLHYLPLHVLYIKLYLTIRYRPVENYMPFDPNSPHINIFFMINPTSSIVDKVNSVVLGKRSNKLRS